MDDKTLIFKILDSNYKITSNFPLSNISVIDKITNKVIRIDELIKNYNLLISDYVVSSEVTSINLCNEWYDDNLKILIENNREMVDKVKTRFKYLVNYSNKKVNVR